jgi:outer membrane protein assembly factor BamB
MFEDHAEEPIRSLPLATPKAARTVPVPEPAPVPETAPAAVPDPLLALHSLLVGEGRKLRELPAVPDLLAGAIALASGKRGRVILPLPSAPIELALVRRGDQLLVDCYTTEDAPEVLVREHAVSLRALLDACADASLALGELQGDTASGRALRSLRDRVSEVRVLPDPSLHAAAVRCSGGSMGSPGKNAQLAFGFSAEIAQALDGHLEPHAFADVHALLFRGSLWAFHGERRVMLMQDEPVMLAAQRMVSAVRALLEAYQAERNMHVRLRSGAFAVAIRRERGGKAALTLGGVRGGPSSVTWPALEVAEAALPILRLVSDLIRKLIAVDRRQSHNLRVAALRSEVRKLRRVLRSRGRVDGFENHDPERLRASAPEHRELSAQSLPIAREPSTLRYTERWSAEIDGLDASAVYLCGDRLVVAAQKLTLALSRVDGQVLWSQPSAGATTLMAGRTLVRVLPDGQVELHEIDTGACVGRAQITRRTGTGCLGLYAGGGDVPPVAILAEGQASVVAIDVRTGQPRWRRKLRGDSGVQLVRSGRVLVMTAGGGAIDAVDIASGEVVWRFSEPVRFGLKPAICGETVVGIAGEPGGGHGAAYGIDLYSGKRMFARELPAAPSAEPIDAQVSGTPIAVIPYGRSRSARLLAVRAEDGELLWDEQDPGLDNGAQTLCVDDALIVNAPSGRVLALELKTGATRWTRSVSNPLTDDVPRQLEPVLRQGALFVPSAQVRVLRPTDGAVLSEPSCDLVPDCLRVDEHAFFYVAEESGHLRAYAPAPHLRLVKA